MAKRSLRNPCLPGSRYLPSDNVPYPLSYPDPRQVVFWRRSAEMWVIGWQHGDTILPPPPAGGGGGGGGGLTHTPGWVSCLNRMVTEPGAEGAGIVFLLQ